MTRITHTCIPLLLLAACGSVPDAPDAGDSPADAPTASDSAPPPDAPGAIDATPDYDASCATPGSMQFDFTGDVQSFVVPDCIDTITVDVYGAAGGDGDGTAVGGRGGRAMATVAVTPGETLEVRVGGAGTTEINAATGGYNGGGGVIDAADPQGTGPSGTGGGASDIRRGSTLDDRLVVAGGGGGGGWGNYEGYGGGGGGLRGEDGNSTDATFIAGGGATQNAGGAVGWFSGNYTNAAGTFGQGATGYHDGAGCGGGGGGWYGGGTGGFAGAGGGSGYVGAPGTTGIAQETGVRDGDGMVLISW